MFQPILRRILHGSKRSRVVFIQDEKVLLIQSWISHQKWTLPGGGIHRGEEPTYGALREIKEELRVQLDKSKLISLGSDDINSHGVTYEATFFAYDLPISPKKNKIELVGMQWFSLEELPKNRSATVDKALALRKLS